MKYIKYLESNLYSTISAEVWQNIKSNITKNTYSLLKEYHNFVNIGIKTITINFEYIRLTIKENNDLYYVEVETNEYDDYFVCDINGLLSLISDNSPFAVNIINKIIDTLSKFNKSSSKKLKNTEFNDNEINKLLKTNNKKLTFDCYSKRRITSDPIMTDSEDYSGIAIQFTINKLEDDYYQITLDSDILEDSKSYIIDQFNPLLKIINKIKIILNEIP